jgi:HAD superfamily hydrolase (TIGR01509 family)
MDIPATPHGPLHGILFDMDGVIVRQCLDFPAIKREMFGDTHGFILERMATLLPSERARAEAVLERHETAAAMTAEPMDGAVAFLAWMRQLGLRSALVTRNSRKSVELIQRRLGLCFDAVVTREDAPPKPAPEPVWLACRRMGISPERALFVGDFELDMQAGRRAGVRTVLLRSSACPASPHADRAVDTLVELRTVLAEEVAPAPDRAPASDDGPATARQAWTS